MKRGCLTEKVRQPFCIIIDISRLCKRIFAFIEVPGRTVEFHIGHAEVLHNFKELLCGVLECDARMVRLLLADQHIPIEARHFGYCEHRDTAEGLGIDRQDLTVCNIAPKLAARGALQAEEGHLAGTDGSL